MLKDFRVCVAQWVEPVLSRPALAWEEPIVFVATGARQCLVHWAALRLGPIIMFLFVSATVIGGWIYKHIS